ncbi:amidohydrolase family protein [Chitinophagaceae bacterium LB-8]|uniref:Amidohydrolase family protein n=1 Tax=Paraflavisolibacter caeni TaxID=2982496 RepID=A0A9X3BFU4_9BACT|nr:amidohydrolase family protein [Paraflavisolibacter caeni]MCU7549669.1 amidohydrolase family protein [Paraflavisolibacter caeni]
MNLIDTHIHIWNFDKAQYKWLEGDTSILNRTYHIEELEEDRLAAGVSGGILVQAANNFEDTDWMLEVAANNDWLKGVVGWLPLNDPAATEIALTEKYLKNRLFKGVRHLIHNEADPKWLLQEEVMESLQILEAHNIPYDVVGIIPAHIETVLKVAEKLPGLCMVFDHLNQPPIATKEKFGRWGGLMKDAAQHQNLYAKISGLGTTSGNFTSWTTDDLKPYVEFALQAFGAERCFCGSDWPVSLLAGNYNKTWQAYTTILNDLLDKEAQQKVLFQNAVDFYNLQDNQ